MAEKFVSIIIPCRRIDSYTRECIAHCFESDYKKYEIIVLPDKKERFSDKKVRIVPTGSVMPAVKRNIGMKRARGSIYAFIDSDAYPARNWLKNAVKYLQDEKMGMVGGPNLTPPKDNFKQKISGILYSKFFVGGRTSIRYRTARKQEAVELPSCNFIVKREYATSFEPDLLTAEDSKFCFNISKKGKRILYVSDVIVYHHRREVFIPHFKQTWIYGRDIALLLRKRGQFSLDKLYYSMHSIFVLGVFLGALLSFVHPFFEAIYSSVMFLYLLLVSLSSLNRDLKAIPYIFAGIIGTHFSYGLGFLCGLLAKKSKKLNLR